MHEQPDNPRPDILLLGGTGQIGWELCRTLAPIGNLVAPGRDQLDLDQPAQIPSFVDRIDPDLIVNAAAFTDVDGAEEQTSAARRLNAEVPDQLARAAAGRDIPLVHYSTDYVFDGRADRPYREDDPTNPLGVYGETKLDGERAVADAADRWLTLRTSWVYSLRRSNFLKTMLRLAETHRQLQVVVDEIGAPTGARAIAEATAQAVAIWQTRGWTADLSGLYHLTADGSTSWHGFAEAIFELAPEVDAETIEVQPIASADYPTAAERPAYSVLSGAKLFETFYLQLPDWRDSLERLFETRQTLLTTQAS